MDLREQVALLHELTRRDAEAAAHYEAALRHIRLSALARPLALFVSDHRRHGEELSARLSAMGIAPGPLPQVPPSLLLPPGADTWAVLAALSGAEERLSQHYAELLEGSWPVELRTVLIHGMADEQRHRAWLLDALRQRPWETPEAAPLPEPSSPPGHGR